MASLDDFFAKKDKSKKKSKAKFTTIDAIAAKRDEEPKKPAPEKRKKESKDKPQQHDGSGERSPTEDEEWKDFDEETDPDYTGLRIQTIQISKEDETEEVEEEEVDEDGEVIERKDSAAGPWAAVQQPKQTTTTTTMPTPAVAEPSAEPAQKTSGKYVPPGMRASAMTPQPLVQRKKKSAPNITSEEDFPTLGIAGDKEREAAQLYMSTGSKFEQVRSGGRQSEDPSSQTPQLTLGNKFQALQRD